MSSNLSSLRHWRWLPLVFLTVSPVLALDPSPEQDTYGLGMGSAVVAVAGGTHAVQWNPAGIARASVPMAQLGLGYDPSSSDLLLNLSALYPLQDGTVFALSEFSEFPKSSGSSSTYVASVAVPLNASNDLFMGVNLKYLVLSALEGPSLQNGRGLGMDLGLSYDLRDSLGTLASFGLAVKDLATDVRFDDNVEASVVRTFVVGAAYQGVKDTRFEADYDIIDQTNEATSLHNRLRIGAEHFFNDRFYSIRAGYDDFLGGDGYFSIGAGYHPNLPFEVAYAFKASTARSDSVHSFSFTYRFEDWKKGEAAPVRASSSAAIDLKPNEALAEVLPAVGNPVSGVPLRKMTIAIDPPVFSPGSRQKTSTTISFPGDQSNDIARWLVEIQDPRQKVVRRIGGTGSLFPMMGWDGTTDEGKPVSYGTYRVTLKTFGKKNELLSDDYQTVEVVTARSHFGIQAASPYFSPKAKGGRREVNFSIQSGGSSAVLSWELEISDSTTDKVVYTTQGKDQLPRNLKWNGRDEKNRTVEDGTYLCFLTAQDRAGNPLKSDAVEIYVTSATPVVALKGDDHWVDPSAAKEFHFQLEAADRLGFQSWKVTVKNENGMTLKSFEGAGQPPKEVVWDGKNSQGNAVEAGALLSGNFQATDKAGNSATSESYPIQVEAKIASGSAQMTLNLTTVYFPLMGTQLSDAAKKDLDKAATTIKPYLNKSTLLVKGYAAANETGDLVALSHSRAAQVKAYLMKVLNVSDNNIFAVGYATRETEKGASPVPEDNQRRALIILSTQ